QNLEAANPGLEEDGAVVVLLLRSFSGRARIARPGRRGRAKLRVDLRHLPGRSSVLHLILGRLLSSPERKETQGNTGNHAENEYRPRRRHPHKLIRSTVRGAP